MKIPLRTAILIFVAPPLVAASTSFGRDLRPVLVESGPAQLLPASTAIVAPATAVPVATATPVLVTTPIVQPVLSPVLVTMPTVTTPAPITPSIIIYPTNPIIFPTNPISPP